MPRQSKGARLWLRPAERDTNGTIVAAARWIIKDAGRQISTSCGEGDREGAEKKLAEYIEQKYASVRREKGRPISEIRVAEVLNIYLADVVPGHANPAVGRCLRLNEYFGDMTLDDINAQVCRDYAATRVGQGRPIKGVTGGSRRDLEELRAAIRHHCKEGYHRAEVRVWLPKKGTARQRWLTRAEFAKLLWVCWSTGEIQDGVLTRKRPLRHLCRFLLLGTYTGSRPGVVMTAAWDQGPGSSWVDMDNGYFHRQPDGRAETNVSRRSNWRRACFLICAAGKRTTKITVLS
jgi:hypothetical protein